VLGYGHDRQHRAACRFQLDTYFESGPVRIDKSVTRPVRVSSCQHLPLSHLFLRHIPIVALQLIADIKARGNGSTTGGYPAEVGDDFLDIITCSHSGDIVYRVLMCADFPAR